MAGWLGETATLRDDEAGYPHPARASQRASQHPAFCVPRPPARVPEQNSDCSKLLKIDDNNNNKKKIIPMSINKLME